MGINEIMEGLDLGKFRVAWAFICNGWAGVAGLVCKAVTKLLGKVDKDRLTNVAECVKRIAEVMEFAVCRLVPEGSYKEASLETARMMGVLASHISDGDYSEGELNEDMANIEKSITVWKNVRKAKDEPSETEDKQEMDTPSLR